MKDKDTKIKSQNLYDNYNKWFDNYKNQLISSVIDIIKRDNPELIITENSKEEIEKIVDYYIKLFKI